MKPDSSLDFLEHYGVKGMKWGVRKEYKSTSRSSASKVSALKAKLKAQDEPLTPDKKAENLAEAKDQFLKKFEPSTASSSSDTTKKIDESEQKGWRPTKKQVGYALMGAAAVGGILYLNHKFKVVPGEPVHPLAFNAQVMKSQQEVWGSHLKVDADSFRQKEFTLPAGHTFRRLSTGPEDSFSFGTYTTSSDADFARYVTAFRHEKGNADFYEINFTAKEDIRIPDLKTRLDALKTSINEGQSKKNKWTDGDVRRFYNGLSGSQWNQDDEIVRGFFAELTKRGYSGIIDDMDAGIIGEAPLVIFNPEKFSSKTSKPLSKDQLKSIEKTVTEITNRRPIGKFNK